MACHNKANTQHKRTQGIISTSELSTNIGKLARLNSRGTNAPCHMTYDALCLWQKRSWEWKKADDSMGCLRICLGIKNWTKKKWVCLLAKRTRTFSMARTTSLQSPSVDQVGAGRGWGTEQWQGAEQENAWTEGEGLVQREQRMGAQTEGSTEDWLSAFAGVGDTVPPKAEV